MRLYAHNQTAYEAMTPMLEICCRAAVIHPTGKSFLFFRFMTVEWITKLEEAGVVGDAKEWIQTTGRGSSRNL